MKRNLLSTLIIASALSACGDSNTESTPIVDNTPPMSVESLKGSTERRAKGASAEDLASLTQGNSTFAFNLYQQMITSQDQQNIVASPHSLSTAFAMLQAGASGNTAAELNATFHFNLANENLHQAFNTLDQTLEEANTTDGMQVSIVNSQWGEKTYDFNEQYSNSLSEFYGADIKLSDFINNPEPTRLLINDWVESQTSNLIQDLMPEQSISGETKMVLVNAVYFNAKWDTPFAASSTIDKDFTHLDNTVTQVPTMNSRHNMSYFNDGNQTIVELPYKGKAFSMFIIHSPVTQFNDIENSLSAENFNQLIAQMETTDIQLSLPKFSFGSTASLSQLLPAMGLNDAFDAQQADFSLMNKRNEQELYIQAAIHKAFINVNEEGTEAGAATGISVGVTSVPETVDINSPFLFVIRHNETGAILFIGRVVNPTAS